jgi:serine/threonine protein kinase
MRIFCSHVTVLLDVQVINNKGYDGAKADLWSCGVILFVLMAGYLPFEDSNLMTLYKRVSTLYYENKFRFSLLQVGG